MRHIQRQDGQALTTDRTGKVCKREKEVKVVPRILISSGNQAGRSVNN